MRRILNFISGKRGGMEESLHREIDYHLDRRTAELINSGLPAVEARRQALVEFGGVAQVQEETRDVWLWRSLLNAGRDARYAVRVLKGSPGFTATAVLSLALGIGANTAIFSILYALLLRSLPVADPERLVVVARNQTVSSPYPLFVELRDHGRSLEGVLAFRTNPLRFSKGTDTERITGAIVSGTYFEVLGVSPSLGSPITKEDDEVPGSGGPRGPVVVLSHSFWLSRFGGQADAVGARVLLNGHPFTVAGVAPAGFSGTEVGVPVDVFAPMTMQRVLMPSLGPALDQPRSQWLRILARLRPGIDPRRAEAELTPLLQRYNEVSFDLATMKDADRRRRLSEQKIVLLPGGLGISELRSQYSKPLQVLISVVTLVLLIACANLASLMLSRAMARRKEIAIRLSLGAARSRIVTQLFIESLVLAALGAGSGLLLAAWIRDFLTRYLPPGRSLDVPMEPGIMIFTLVLGAGAAILFGLAPAFQGTNIDVGAAIKGESATKHGRVLFRKGLVVLQLSLSFVLLIGAALFLRSLHNLLTIDPGFAREHILVASVESAPRLQSRLLQELKYLPGLKSAALADAPPLGFHTGWTIYSPGYDQSREPRDSPSVGFVSSGYFKTMEIPLLAGRDIEDRDVQGAREVMVVNESFARHFFGNQNPIGRRVGTTEGQYQWEIVGVVKDGKYTGLREEPLRMIYVPARPGPWASRTTVHLRTASHPAALAAALRRKVHEVDPAATIFDVHTVKDALERSLLRERLVGTITALFGGLALILAVVGLYGLMSYNVARRTREIGIRIAIGAQTGSILRLVVGEAVWLLAVGGAIGLAAAWALGRYLQSMLFGVEPADPLSTWLAILALSAAALAAAWIPARRASRIDPLRALHRD